MSSKILFICRATLLCFCLIIILLIFVPTSQSADSVSNNSNHKSTDTGIGEIVKNDFSTESLWFGYEEPVTIASKIEESVREAPAVVTVITSEEIENMGVKTITDILRILPGFDLLKNASTGEVKVGSRGVMEASEGIKVLIDGHSINMPLFGDAFLFFDDLPLKNVKSIEIIKGPGSALYGANAFRSVINIITKSASDIDGLEVSSGFGSYDTQEYSIMYGENIFGVDIAAFVDYYNTNGLSDTIKGDALSPIPFFKRFTLTPGDSDDSRNKLDMYLKLSYKDFELNAKYMNKDTEPFVGTGFVLTEDSEQRFNYVMADLTYEFDIWERVAVKPRLYYDQYETDLFEEALPDGFTRPNDLDGDGDIERFPEGDIGHVVVRNRRLGADLQMDYDLFDKNIFTLGFAFEWEKQDNVNSFSNFDPANGASIGFMQDFTDTANMFREVTRKIWAIYFQDKWDITEDLGLTIGIRHDHYSDFEGTTNPRIGLVWDFMHNATIKFLYGQAFRAPAFDELFAQNNSVVAGNPNLKPETIRTYEVALDYRVLDKVAAKVNYFFNVGRDEILFLSRPEPELPRTFANVGSSNIQGIEFEIKADLSDYWDGAYAFANYTYQDAESKGDPLPDVPKHKGNVGLNAKVTKYLNANLHAFISGSRIREEPDSREDSPGYALLNLTLTAKDFFKGIKIKASLNNLLDKNYNDPTPMNTIATDIPRPGRTFSVELGYKF